MSLQGSKGSVLFMRTAMFMLLLALLFGLLSAWVYLHPLFLKNSLGFQSLRPFHVSAAMGWILSGSIACIGMGFRKSDSPRMLYVQWLLWVIAFSGVFYSYAHHQFGGREYWEFNPVWALPLAGSWLILLYRFFRSSPPYGTWPVYRWMWMTGIVFFLFTFCENYLWLLPYFRSHFISDTTIQWKVNGSLVGSWNQILYGTAFYLMQKLSGERDAIPNRMAFAMYFLGLANLMFNWGHHIYTLPIAPYVRYVGYAVSMTEWIFFIRILAHWRKKLSPDKQKFHLLTYRFLLAADVWAFLNLLQALAMSVPAINLYTHGTHITVAHAMGTTIGINTMILMAAAFDMLGESWKKNKRGLLKVWWMLQMALLVFWLSLLVLGIQKALWQMNEQQSSFSKMMQDLQNGFWVFVVSGFALALTLGYFILQWFMLSFVSAKKR